MDGFRQWLSLVGSRSTHLDVPRCLQYGLLRRALTPHECVPMVMVRPQHFRQVSGNSGIPTRDDRRPNVRTRRRHYRMDYPTFFEQRGHTQSEVRVINRRDPPMHIFVPTVLQFTEDIFIQ